MLGYTQVSWDDESGRELQPPSSEKYWAQLTDKERAAATVLGYTKAIWNQPASVDKYWNELTSCGMWRAFISASLSICAFYLRWFFITLFLLCDLFLQLQKGVPIIRQIVRMNRKP